MSLTSRQRDVLAIFAHLSKEQRIVTVRDVQAAMDAKSNGSTYYRLQALCERGMLTQDCQGTFYITQRGWVYLKDHKIASAKVFPDKGAPTFQTVGQAASRVLEKAGGKDV